MTTRLKSLSFCSVREQRRAVRVAHKGRFCIKLSFFADFWGGGGSWAGGRRGGGWGVLEAGDFSSSSSLGRWQSCTVILVLMIKAAVFSSSLCSQAASGGRLRQPICNCPQRG